MSFIVSIDWKGRVSVLSCPTITEENWGVLEDSRLVEEALPYDLPLEAGVYQLDCHLIVERKRDWEGTPDDDWWFEVDKTTQIWDLKQGGLT